MMVSWLSSLWSATSCAAPMFVVRIPAGSTSFRRRSLAHLGRHIRLKGIGPILLVEALKSAVAAADIVGSRLVVLNAKTERVARWFESLSFRRTNTDPLRLYMRMATARNAAQSLSQ
jgi:hypothetical protein